MSTDLLQLARFGLCIIGQKSTFAEICILGVRYINNC